MIENELEERYGECLDGLDIYENNSSLRLSRIIIKKECRGNGFGSKLMEDLVNYADRNKQIITLTPSSDLGGNKNRLIQFYKRFGFKHNKGVHKSYEFNDTMIRYPKLNESTKSLIKRLLRESTETFTHYNDDGTKETIVGKHVYVRFGLPPKDENNVYQNSSCYSLGDKHYEECGISVFEAIKTKNNVYVFTRGSKMNSSYDELINSTRKAYIVTEEPTYDEGADGEILLDRHSFKVIAEINKKILIQSR